MHEAGLMQTALDLACDHARRAGAGRIHRVLLRVGALSGVDPDALRFAFEALSPGTPAEDAALVVEVVPARGRCHGCGREFEPDLMVGFICPACGAAAMEVLAGGELELASVEVDMP